MISKNSKKCARKNQKSAGSEIEVDGSDHDENKEREYTVRYTNWIIVARLLEKLDPKIVLKCFEFDGGVKGHNQRKILDMFKVFRSDYTLPKEIRFMCGKRFGVSPGLGFELDAELFKLVLAAYIRPNQTKLNNLDQSVVLINHHVVNPIIRHILSDPGLDEETKKKFGVDYKYTKGQIRRFRRRWYICPYKGVLLPPPETPQKILEYSQYAIDNKYDQLVQSESSDSESNDNDSESASSSVTQQVTTDLTNTGLPCGPRLSQIMYRNNIRDVANQFVASRDTYR
jgi:hypothetical protein